LEAGSAQNALKKAIDSESFPDDAVGIRIVDTVTKGNIRGPEYEDVTVYHMEYLRD
jgi:hypothetical protein